MINENPAAVSAFDWFTDLLREAMKQPQVKILNLRRFEEFLSAKTAFDRLLAENGEGISEISLHLMFNSASFSAEVESFEIHDQTLFRLAMDTASNFEIHPLVNGNMRISFMFREIFISEDRM